MARIRHVAIMTHDPARLAKFYVDVFGLKVLQPLVSAPGRGTWVFLTDGEVRLALVNPGTAEGGAKGIHHFAVAADEGERQGILQRLREQGITPELCANPYLEDRVRDIDGNVVDVSGNEVQLLPGVRLTPG